MNAKNIRDMESLLRYFEECLEWEIGSLLETDRLMWEADKVYKE
jgi:hypothetical protein